MGPSLKERALVDLAAQLFSSLYSMLPKSKDYLIDGGFSPAAASYLLICLFLAGVVGIRILSGLLHRFIPSHVVDCDHTHDEESTQYEEMEEHHDHHHENGHASGIPVVKLTAAPEDEETPLLARQTSFSPPKPRILSEPPYRTSDQESETSFTTAAPSRKPLYMPRGLSRTFTKLAAVTKTPCSEAGPCKGYSDPCGQDCFKGLTKRGSLLPGGGLSRLPILRSSPSMQNVPTIPEISENTSHNHSPGENDGSRSSRNDKAIRPLIRSWPSTHHYHRPLGEHHESMKQDRRGSVIAESVGPEHHHHVPTNAFMAIGLQTSIAIALHKAPEGFITYATNHANPTLGFTVFMALFIHNITEGFALALPLYLALGSRFKAMFWSAFLGGLSQPIGAGVAALWFKLARGKDGMGSPDEKVYGSMFAITAGVMASVALSLFSESLALSHNKNVCISFAFLGMGILGISFALTK
jgi:zinc transporter, ZIP family